MRTEPALDPRQDSLADLATRRPGAARVFHEHGLDFCCHGQVSLAEAANDDLDASRRWINLSKGQAEGLGLAEGDLIEMVNPRGAAALRCWVRLIDGGEAGKTALHLGLGPIGHAARGTRPGDTVEIRKLGSALL